MADLEPTDDENLPSPPFNKGGWGDLKAEGWRDKKVSGYKLQVSGSIDPQLATRNPQPVFNNPFR
jgi:hypothetical protein